MLNPQKIHTGLLSVPRRREFLGILSTEWKDGCTQRVVDCSLFYLGKFQYTQAKRVSWSKRFIHSERPGQTFPASLLPNIGSPCKNRPLLSIFVANHTWTLMNFVHISPQPRVHPVALGHVRWRSHGCQGLFPCAPWKQSRKLCISKFRVGRKAVHWLIGADEFWFESRSSWKAICCTRGTGGHQKICSKLQVISPWQIRSVFANPSCSFFTYSYVALSQIGHPQSGWLITVKIHLWWFGGEGGWGRANNLRPCCIQVIEKMLISCWCTYTFLSSPIESIERMLINRTWMAMDYIAQFLCASWNRFRCTSLGVFTVRLS